MLGTACLTVMDWGKVWSDRISIYPRQSTALNCSAMGPQPSLGGD